MSACPYCHSSENKKSYLEDTFFNQKTFSYLACKKCGVIYIHPFPDTNDYAAMYPVEYQGHVYTEATGKYKQLFAKIKSYKPEAKSLLDYGCGNSELVVDAQNHHFEVSGVEYNPDFVAHLKRNIPTVPFISIEDFHSDKEQTYDVIVLNNVLEHLTNPNEILSLIHSKLSDGGLLVCLGPIENNFNLAQRFRKLVFGIRNRVFHKKASHVPYHITFTHVKNQKMIFEQNKFKELYFNTEETAWPFPAKIDFKSPKSLIFGTIAKISIKLSKVFSKDAGNIFTYIGKK